MISLLTADEAEDMTRQRLQCLLFLCLPSNFKSFAIVMQRKRNNFPRINFHIFPFGIRELSRQKQSRAQTKEAPQEA